MTIITSISISPEFQAKAKSLKLSWSEAARIGMSILLAERGAGEYDNKLNLFRKMTLFRQQAENALQKLAELEAKETIEKTPTIDPLKEATDILDSLKEDDNNKEAITE